jgi:DNA polymerase III delta subunit
MLHLIIGECPTLINDTISKIIAKTPTISFDSLNEKTNLDTITQRIQSCDMFSSHNGFKINSPLWLTKPSKPELSQIKETLTLATQYQLPIILITKKIDKRSVSYKLLKSLKATEYECQPFKDWETDKLILWIKESASKQSINIEDNVIEHFISNYGTNLGIINQELTKCITSIHPKTTLTIKDLLGTSGNALGYYNNLSNTLKHGNYTKIIQQINQLLSVKEDPHKIFNHILFQINQIHPLSCALKLNINSDQYATQTKKHPFFIKKQMEEIKQNKHRGFLKPMLQLLATMDKLIKKGELNARQSLIYFNAKLKHHI